MKLTALILPTLAPGEWPDHLTQGLLFRVGARSRTWELRYRSNGKRKRVQLGHHPKMGLAEARTAAKEALDRVEHGAPPVAAPVVHPRNEPSLGDMIDRYEKIKRREGGSGRAFEGGFRAVRSGLKDYLDLPAKAFSKADLRTARDKIADRAPSMSNRFLAYLSPIMRWGAQEDIILTNFVGDLRKHTEVKRERVLSHTEIQAVWKACDKIGTGASAQAFGRMVRFALLTLQRRDEVASIKHGDILDGVWRQERNKSSRPHRLKLSPTALDLVGKGTPDQLCFAGVSGQISGFSKLKKRLDELSGVTGWRLHDLRRTGATQMQELGISRDIISGVLNHAISDVGGVYMRGEMERAKGEALATWATELQRIVSAKKVVSIKRTKRVA